MSKKDPLLDVDARLQFETDIHKTRTASQHDGKVSQVPPKNTGEGCHN